MRQTQEKNMHLLYLFNAPCEETHCNEDFSDIINFTEFIKTCSSSTNWCSPDRVSRLCFQVSPIHSAQNRFHTWTWASRKQTFLLCLLTQCSGEVLDCDWSFRRSNPFKVWRSIHFAFYNVCDEEVSNVHLIWSNIQLKTVILWWNIIQFKITISIWIYLKL